MSGIWKFLTAHQWFSTKYHRYIASKLCGTVRMPILTYKNGSKLTLFLSFILFVCWNVKTKQNWKNKVCILKLRHHFVKFYKACCNTATSVTFETETRKRKRAFTDICYTFPKISPVSVTEAGHFSIIVSVLTFWFCYYFASDATFRLRYYFGFMPFRSGHFYMDISLHFSSKI